MSLERTSRYMSLILRHKPEVIGIQLDEHGWANVEELIAGIAKTQEFNRDILELIVRTDEKQRYSFNEDGTLIRANQGHSIPVDVELKEMQPPETLWHGTGETAKKVGQRHGIPVLYLVKAEEMYNDGYRFYRSENGVWLTKEVPVKYLERKSK